MSSPAKIALVVVLVAVIGVCVWAVVRSVMPGPAPKPTLGWQCSKCGERFQAGLEQDAEAVYSETEAFPKIPCPKCEGDAFRIHAYRCEKCGNEFDLLLAPDPETGKPPRFACPKCGDPRIVPRDVK